MFAMRLRLPSHWERAGGAPAAEDPANFVVKIGKRAGKTLGEIYCEGSGTQALQFYAAMAAGDDPDKHALKNAAAAFLAKHTVASRRPLLSSVQERQA